MVTFKNILFPINLDSTNLSFVKKVLDIALQLNGRLHILYVNDEQAGYRHPTDREDAVALKVQEAVPEDLLSKVSPVYAIAKGTLAEQIEAYCKKESIELIIVGHKQRSMFYRAVFDSPDVNIIDSVNIPILVIPKKMDE
ncbi:MAG: universal stress protein [Spirochaetes bacterium]|nr:universal stress protein [Spirochaetota bacterium]